MYLCDISFLQGNGFDLFSFCFPTSFLISITVLHLSLSILDDDFQSDSGHQCLRFDLNGRDAKVGSFSTAHLHSLLMLPFFLHLSLYFYISGSNFYLLQLCFIGKEQSWLFFIFVNCFSCC